MDLSLCFILFSATMKNYAEANHLSRVFRDIDKICARELMTIDKAVLIVNQVLGKATGFEAGEQKPGGGKPAWRRRKNRRWREEYSHNTGSRNPRLLRDEGKTAQPVVRRNGSQIKLERDSYIFSQKLKHSSNLTLDVH